MDDTLLQDEPLGHKLIKKSFWIYFFLFFTAPAGYFIKVIISNKLSVGDVGLFFSISGFVTVLSLYNDLGLTEALQYFIPQYRIKKEYNKIKTITYLTWLAQLISGVLVSGILYLTADRLALNYFHDPAATGIIKLFCLYFFGINFIQAFMSFFIAFQDTFNQNLLDFVKSYATLIFTVFFWLTNTLSILSFTWAWLIGIFASIAVGIIIFFNKYNKQINRGTFERDHALIKQQLQYAIRVFLGANAGVLLTQVNQQMVIYFLGAEQAGYYANYFTLFMIYGVIVGPILGLLFPIFTQLITQRDHTKIALFQNLLYKYFLMFALSISGLFFAFGPEIASVFFGTKFEYSGTLMMYSAPFLTINMLLAVNFSILAGMGKIRERVRYLGAALAVNIIANIIFIPVLHWGLMGTIIATVLSWGVMWRFSFRVVHHYQPISFDRSFFGKNLCMIGLLSGVFLITKNTFFVIDNNYRLQNILYLFLASFVYYACIAFLNTKNIFELIHEAKKFITVKKNT